MDHRENSAVGDIIAAIIGEHESLGEDEQSKLQKEYI